ncbi:sorting nexin-16 isoform X3 [Carassius carassius]|uniref:sorting nexin-16 isoform X3 n=1 Tax=Carassius carassius TaxID=217509 RepID=UPI0028697D01|nr:sorting nexin-16 isoform X3 [Carassius carassius]
MNHCDVTSRRADVPPQIAVCGAMATPFVPVPVPIECAPRPDSKSPVTSARLHGTERSVEYSSCPLPETPIQSWEERPITPTVLGYEVMEERAKFTVYKVLVKKTVDESWVVFRRYTDFSRLNDKLKDMFPGFRLSLPPKRWFKDNYETEFLEDRQLGLQAFLQNLVAHKDISNCVAVREFLCLDDPPGPFDSLEESRGCAPLVSGLCVLVWSVRQRRVSSRRSGHCSGPLSVSLGLFWFPSAAVMEEARSDV